MTETELKFQVPPGRGAAVARAMATASAKKLRLVAAYADTADRRLAAAGLALRLRREGRQWVQTLKGRGDGLMQRPEHEVKLSTAATMPDFDARRHAGTPVGERLLSLLADGAPLEVLYRTDVQRVFRTVRSGGAQVELAHDRGRIEAAGRHVVVDELEFELKSGPAPALAALAGRWAQRHGLWWDVRTKSERGFRLAEHRDQVEAVHATASTLSAGQSAGAALATALMDALAQVLPNGAELAAGTATAEHLHQLRVGLRRLRSLLREALALEGSEAWAAEAQALERQWAGPFGQLGAARDADALSARVWPELQKALAAAGLPPLDLPADPDGADPGEVWRSVLVQGLLLQSLALALKAKSNETPPATQAQVAGVLQPLFKRIKRASHDLAAADPDSLHALRKRLKRLRYVLQALGPLLKRKRVERFQDALRPALNRLGELNDLHTAELRLAALADTTPGRWFALGHVAAWRAALLPPAQRALDLVFSDPPPWR